MRLNMKYFELYFFSMKQIEHKIPLQKISQKNLKTENFCLNIILHVNTSFGMELDENTSVIFL